jgi:hypothetical protein
MYLQFVKFHRTQIFPGKFFEYLEDGTFFKK